MGDVVRRLIANIMSDQMMVRFETAAKPFQYVLSTRAGCESIAHIVHSATDNDARATVLSIDGVGAFDLISCRAMMMLDGQFYGLLQHICGKTRMGRSVKFSRGKAESKETH